MALGLQARRRTVLPLGRLPSAGLAAAVVGIGLLVLLTVAGAALGIAGAVKVDPRPAWFIAGQVAVVLAGVAAAGLDAPPVVPSRLWGWLLLLASLACPQVVLWTALPGRLDVILLAASTLSVAGLSLVAGAASRRVLVLSGCAFLLYALGVDPLTDLSCWESCQQQPSPLPTVLTTGTVIRLCIGLLLLGVAAVTRQLLTPSDPGRCAAERDGGALAACCLLAAAWLPRLVGLHSATAIVGERVLVGAAVLAVALSDLGHAAARVKIRRAARALVAGLQDADITAATGENHQVLAAMTTSQRLALRNAQLTAQVRAGVAEVEASRSRIVAATDAERRRMERDLHDGTQQRLVSVLLHFQVAIARTTARDTKELRQAEAEVQKALIRLRQLSRGLSLDTLESEGLRAALVELVAEAGVPARLELDEILPKPDHGVSFALHEVAARTLRTLAALPARNRPPGEITVRLCSRPTDLSVTLVIPVAEPEPLEQQLLASLQRAHDRVAVAGGVLEFNRIGRLVKIEAVVPCGS